MEFQFYTLLGRWYRAWRIAHTVKNRLCPVNILIYTQFRGVELTSTTSSMASLMRSFLNQDPPPLPHLRPSEMGPAIRVIKPSCLPDEAHFTWKNERFICCCAVAHPANARARKERKSVIWWYEEDIVEESDIELKHPYWYCYLCEEESVEMNNLLALGEGNNSMLAHLERSH